MLTPAGEQPRYQKSFFVKFGKRFGASAKPRSYFSEVPFELMLVNRLDKNISGCSCRDAVRCHGLVLAAQHLPHDVTIVAWQIFGFGDRVKTIAHAGYHDGVAFAGLFERPSNRLGSIEDYV